jgi:hypothetical protein
MMILRFFFLPLCEHLGNDSGSVRALRRLLTLLFGGSVRVLELVDNLK